MIAPSQLIERHYHLDGASWQLVLPHDVLKHMAKYRQIRPWDKERGGQLFAVERGSDLHIVSAAGPNRADQSGRTRLVFDLCAMTKDRFIEFERGRHFVGFWHTHPETHPSPSGVDLDAVVPELAAHAGSRNGLLTIIVGNSPSRLNLWVGVVEQGGRVTKLGLV